MVISCSSYVRPGIRPSGMPVARLDDTGDGVDAREVVAGVGESDVPGRGIEHRVEAGDEHVRRHLRAQELVRPAEDGARVDQARRIGRKMLWVVAITIAAGTPLSVTSPTTSPMRPSGSGMKS